MPANVYCILVQASAHFFYRDYLLFFTVREVLISLFYERGKKNLKMLNNLLITTQLAIRDGTGIKTHSD